MIFIVLSLAMVTVATVWDWRTGQIPNWLTLPPLVAAPIIYGVGYGSDQLLASLAGLFGCGLGPYVLFRRKAMGGGDVKLFAALGALNGFSMGMEMFALIMLAGALQACFVLYSRHQLGAVLSNTFQMAANLFRAKDQQKALAAEAMTEMRLGPALLVGTVLAIAGL